MNKIKLIAITLAALAFLPMASKCTYNPSPSSVLATK